MRKSQNDLDSRNVTDPLSERVKLLKIDRAAKQHYPCQIARPPRVTESCAGLGADRHCLVFVPCLIYLCNSQQEKDQHLMDTLETIAKHRAQKGKEAAVQ